MWHLAAALIVCMISLFDGRCGIAGMRSPLGFGIIDSSMQAWLPSGSLNVKTRDIHRVGS